MKELNISEVQEVSGGVHPQVVGLAFGLLGSYIYDSLGGLQGINNGISRVVSAAMNYSSQLANDFAAGKIKLRGKSI